MLKFDNLHILGVRRL